MVAKPDTGTSRIRVVAQRAKPSNQVKVRILARDGGAPPPPSPQGGAAAAPAQG